MNAPSPRVVLRADSSPESGLGHVSRTLTLGAEMARLGCGVVMLTAHTDPIQARCRQSGIELHRLVVEPGGEADASATVSSGADLVIVDGYHFSEGFFTCLAKALPHVVLDDNGDTAAREPIAVLNQNPHATADMYRPLGSAVEVLAGLDYALIRASLRSAGPVPLADRSGVLVAFGGSDVMDLTDPVAHALLAQGAQVRVARGPLARPCDHAGLQDVTPEDFETSLASSELAVVAAGSMMWETAYLNVPTVAVVVAENQEHAARGAAEIGIVSSIDARDPMTTASVIADVAVTLQRDGSRMSAMMEATESAVDGRGAERAAERIAARYREWSDQ